MSQPLQVSSCPSISFLLLCVAAFGQPGYSSLLVHALAFISLVHAPPEFSSRTARLLPMPKTSFAHLLCSPYLLARLRGIEYLVAYGICLICVLNGFDGLDPSDSVCRSTSTRKKLCLHSVPHLFLLQNLYKQFQPSPKVYMPAGDESTSPSS